MTSVIFPGQGSQFPGMARDFYDNFREFKDVFLEIEDSTKIHLDKIIFCENPELLNATNFTQISIFAVSIGIYKTLESSFGFDIQNSNIKYMLGHSLGEYSAIAASKSLSISEVSLLLKKRGELMNSAVEPNSTSMAALIGLSCDKIENIIKKNNLEIEIANDNSPGQVVVSGFDTDILNSEKQYLIDGKAGVLFKNYQQRLLDMNYVDFADLLLHNLNIFNSHQDVLDKLKIKIKYFLIDEYQDTNTAQYLWLKMLVKPENNICCVGDDDQSIYGWRGADVRNILNFEKDFNDAKILRLEENYRSSKYILSAANTLIANNKYRLGKSLKTSIETGEKINIVQAWDGLDEARKISTKIETLIKLGVNFDEIAVLVRAGYQTRLFEERFVHIGLPY